jgi:hypothetical protein
MEEYLRPKDFEGSAKKSLVEVIRLFSAFYHLSLGQPYLISTSPPCYDCPSSKCQVSSQGDQPKHTRCCCPKSITCASLRVLLTIRALVTC